MKPSEDHTVRGLLQLSTLSLATSDASGLPHVAAVYFAADEELYCYFLSQSGSQHSQDLEKNPRAAIAIYPECWAWQQIHGLQMRGEARSLPPGPARELGRRLFEAKFTFLSALAEAVSRSSWYVFQPSWIRLIDNRRGFGYKQEWITR